MTMSDMPVEIAKALVICQGLMRRVGQDGDNQFHRYRYTSCENILESVREPMRQAGLALLQVPVSVERSSYEGAPNRLVMQYYITHESGAVWTMPLTSTPILAEKGRPEDKAEATAMTYSLGYMLRGILKIARWGADDDVDQRDDRARGAGPQQPQAPEAPADGDAIAREVAAIVGAIRSAQDAAGIEAARGRARLISRKLTAQHKALLTEAAAQADARLQEGV